MLRFGDVAIEEAAVEARHLLTRVKVAAIAHRAEQALLARRVNQAPPFIHTRRSSGDAWVRTPRRGCRTLQISRGLAEGKFVDQYNISPEADLQKRRGKAVGLEAIVGRHC